MDKPRKNWKKILIAMRADIVIFVVLIVIGSVSFSFVKTALLKNSQELVFGRQLCLRGKQQSYGL